MVFAINTDFFSFSFTFFDDTVFTYNKRMVSQYVINSQTS